MLALVATARCGGEEAVVEPSSTCPSFIPVNAGLPSQGEWRTHPSIGDVNGDGLADFAALARKAAGPRVFTSDGLGNWSELSEGLAYRRGFSCGIGTRLADLDADGDLDLTIADHCEGVLVYRGDGQGGWTESSRGIPRNLEGFNDAAVGDLDGDGWKDVVAVSAFTRGFLVLQGRADGSWVPRFDTGLPVAGSGWQIEIEDLNADGMLDVLTTFNPISTDRRQPPAPPSMVWLQGPAFSFRPATGFESDGRHFGVALLRRGPALPPDVIVGVYGFHAGLYRYTSDDGEHWTSLGRVDEGWFPEGQRGFAGVRVADLDADGCEDIVASEATTVALLVALGDCQGGFELCPVATVPREPEDTASWGLAIGDLNADGRADLVAGLGTHQGRLSAWYQVDRATAEAWKRNQGQGPPALSAAQAGEAPPP